MHVVVQERTKEIGVKIALGAHKKMILTQFLIEGMLLTALGGTLGFAFAFGVIALMPLFELKEYIGTPSVDTLGIIVAATVLGIVGITSGFFPAKRASNMQPVQAIKLF